MLHLNIKYVVWPLLRESRKTHTHTHAHTHTHTLHFVLTAPPFSPLIASESEGPLPVTQAALARLGPDPTVLGLCEHVNVVYHPTKSISLRDLQGRGWKHCFTNTADTDLLRNRIYSTLSSGDNETSKGYWTGSGHFRPRPYRLRPPLPAGALMAEPGRPNTPVFSRENVSRPPSHDRQSGG